MGDNSVAEVTAAGTVIMTLPATHTYMTITVTVCLTLATPVVWTRLYVHFRVTNQPRWDDILVLISWLGLVAYCTGLLVALNYGRLTGFENLTTKDLMLWDRLIWELEMMYTVVIFLAKLPVLVLYSRIFVPPNGKRTWVYRTITFFIVFNAFFYLANLMGVAFSCIPTARIWDKSIPGNCYSIYGLFVGTAVINVLSDSFMAVIPVAVVLNLQMPRKRKVDILFVFAFGVICALAAIFRMIYSIIGIDNPNQSIALVDIALWTIAEVTSCVITACVPMVPTMIRSCRGFRSRSRSVSAPPANPKQRNVRKKSAFGMSWLRTTLASHSAEEEDPYCLVDRSSATSRQDSETTRVADAEVASATDSDIVVSTTVEITSVHDPYFSKGQLR